MIKKIRIKNLELRIKNGFTLIELLVVISIIGILAAMLTSSFSEAQKNSRDAKRRGDLKSIQNALEQYRVSNGTYPGGTYPGNASNIPPIVPPVGIAMGDYFQNNVIPTDPRGGNNYHAASYTTSAYSICADLEKTLTWSGTSPTDDVCVSNLQ